MRFLSAVLSVSLLLVLSLAGCNKKEETQNPQPASNEAATNTATPPATAPATTTPESQPEPATPPPAGQPAATQPAGTQPAPVGTAIQAAQKIPIRPGFVGLSDRNSIAGSWRGTLVKANLPLIFHFNADGWGSLDSPKQNLHAPASIALESGNVTIDVPSTPGKFVGTLKDGKMSGRWTQEGYSDDIQLTKD